MLSVSLGPLAACSGPFGGSIGVSRWVVGRCYIWGGGCYGGRLSFAVQDSWIETCSQKAITLYSEGDYPAFHIMNLEEEDQAKEMLEE